MTYNNNATHFRRQVLVKIASLAFEGGAEEKIDRLPLEIIPRNSASFRCCIHHDRAVIKYRAMAALGFAVEEEEDELKPLSAYAREAGARSKTREPILTVAHEACSACVRSHYFVTNACRGCVARPCQVNCPKKSITIDKGQARIDPETCVTCGLCQKVCPYHAIVKVPVPCEEACPVVAISKDSSGKETIDYGKCIFCGKCLTECPYGAVMERSQIVDVIRAMREGRHVTALYAPAIAGQYPAEPEKTVAAIRRVGFSEVLEVALGADETIRREAAEFSERLENGAPFMTTSCCSAYTECVSKHIPGLKPFVSATRSPMHYAAALAKRKNPDTVAVFIGPCVAKKQEALGDSLVDYVLNAEELGAMFVARGVDVASCEPETADSTATAGGRGFPVAGGVAAAVAARAAAEGSPAVRPILVNGLSDKAVKQLKLYAGGKAEGNLIEVMACEGGCVAGPAVISKPAVAAKKIQDLMNRSGKEAAAAAAR
jgi:[FeFe] hydrogenase (group B1/B3)